MIEVELPDGTIAEFPDDMQPAQIESVLAAQFGAPQKQAPAQPKQSGFDRFSNAVLDNPIGRGVSEFAAAANRSVFGVLDVVPGAINEASNLIGSDYRVPTFRDTLGHEGGFMGEGLARDAVSAAGEAVPMALGAGGLIRGAAQKLPSLAGSESVGAGLLRQMGQSTARGDVALGAAGGAGGAIGGDIGESVGGETGRTVGTVLGGIAAPVAATAPAAVVKGAFRGGERGREVLAKAVDDFAEFDSAPTVGVGTGDNLRRGLENLSSRYLGGGALRKAADDTAEKMKERLTSIADDISRTVGDDEAGRVIERGIKGEGGFIDRFQSQNARLWGQLDSKIPQDSPVKPGNTVNALQEMVRDDAIGKVLNNPKMTGISSALRTALDPAIDDATGEMLTDPNTGLPVLRKAMSYGDLKSLRSKVGEMVASKDLISDIPRAQLKRLYGALSDDVRAAADAAGASKEFSRANNYTRAGHNRISGFVEKVVNKDELNKIFEAAAKGGDGLQRINSIKRSLKPEEWEVVSSNVVRRLGLATKGQQGAAGEEFSVAKFLTDWNKLGRAKNVIFSGSEKLSDYRKNLDRIARASERMKVAAREMSNPSGTAQAAANYGTITAGGAAIATGNIPVLSGVLMAVAGNKGASSLMANPDFVRWLARGTKTTNWPAHIARLSAINYDQEEIAEFAEDLASVIQTQQKSQPQKKQDPQGRQ